MENSSLSLYVHWPFCLAKCPYCDFNSHVREAIPQARFAAALRRELAFESARLGPRPLRSIFFGGGTPSLMDPDTVARLIEDAVAAFPPLDGLEITLEANPTSVEARALAGFRQAGVNRVSLGVQSLRDDALRGLGRGHSAAQARAALELARDLFPRLSFDLIYARPGQDAAAWRAELREALALGADHLSLYQLTIEPGTGFEALARRGELAMPGNEESARLYRLTGEETEAAGFRAYEISNHAPPGGEGRHNLGYWRHEDYLGIGPGAHGRVTHGGRVLATRRHRAPEPWAALVEARGHGADADIPLAAEERAREMLLMGLRLEEGVRADRFQARTGMELLAAIAPDTLRQALDEAYLAWDGAVLRALPEGRLRLNALLAALVALGN